MEIQSYEHGVRSWVDLATPDPAAAAAFYRGLFGWDVRQGPPEAGGYAIAHLRDRTVAGIGPQQYPGPAAWMTYVNVSDAEAIAEAVVAAGGRVLSAPMPVMDAGQMAVFEDPSGAVFAVWQPGTHRGAPLVNEPGTFGWAELVTTDVEGAKRFYPGVFGWEYESAGPEGPGGYTEWKVSGRPVAGMMATPETLPPEVPPYWGVYFMAADTDETLARATGLGGSVVVPARDIEPGRFGVISDPAGAVFSVLTMREAASG